MKVVVNGAEREIESTLTVAALLAREWPGVRRVAVEVNGQIVPRSRHTQRRLAPGDRLEIVQAIGGG
ncbi:MAG: sulfur carrier protein ThiS [Gammaproteobacteria bacterium]|nr:sulfur carrier protein ThiS [Gammaproteobacteria bacterium]